MVQKPGLLSGSLLDPLLGLMSTTVSPWAIPALLHRGAQGVAVVTCTQSSSLEPEIAFTLKVMAVRYFFS